MDIIEQIEGLTENNCAIHSYVLGAQYLKNEKLRNIFKGIQKIQEEEHCLPTLLKDYRYKKYQEMIEYAKSILSPEIFERFRGAF
jgi:hypothetical protein